MQSELWKQLDALIAESGLRVTFSINCHSGLASLIAPDHQCGCWRCREKRGEAHDEHTEAQAKADSQLAQKLMRQRIKEQFDAQH